jgi:hypothetical protein
MAPHIYLNPFFQKNFTQNQSYGIDMDYITLTQRLWDKKKPTFIGMYMNFFNYLGLLFFLLFYILTVAVSEIFFRVFNTKLEYNITKKK